MLAGSAAAQTAPRVRHVLLALALFLVTFSIIGMHQLSLKHDFAAPQTGTSQPAGAHHQTAGEAQHQTAAENAAGSTPDHPGHDVALGACLLALTLLVLSWWLAPPRVRYLPPRLLWRQAAVPIQRGRWVSALSLAQLCALRT